ncbi:MAG: sigma-70 family RNA polymerase sigma factor [Aristaeellaceae bacterium]
MVRLNDAQRSLVEQNLPLVGFVLRRRFPGQFTGADREDALQEGFIALCKAAVGYRPGSIAFSTYACRCIYVELLKSIRLSRAACRNPAMEAASLDDADFHFQPESPVRVEDAATVRLLMKRIGDLPPMERSAMLMAMEGLSQDAIGARLHMSQATVSRMLMGIRRQLREEVVA